MPDESEPRMQDEHKAEKTQTYLLFGFTVIASLVVYSYISDRSADNERVVKALEFRDQRITGIEQTVGKLDARLREVEFRQRAAIAERQANDSVMFKEIDILRRRVGETQKR